VYTFLFQHLSSYRLDCKCLQLRSYVTIAILDNFHHPVFYLKHGVLKTRFCLRLQVEPTQLGPIARASLSLRTPVVEAEINLRPTVSRPVCLGVRRPSGTRDQYFFLLEISFRQLRVCYFVAPSLTRGRAYNLQYKCYWALPEQLLLGRSPAELKTIFYCLI
jgi:hypothetical protein